MVIRYTIVAKKRFVYQLSSQANVQLNFRGISNKKL